MAIRDLFVVVSLIAGPASALAAGTITGTVRIDRAPPRPAAVKIGKDASVCGQDAAYETWIVSAQKQVANVVLGLKGAKAPKPLAPTPGASVDQVGCHYAPHVQAVTLGTPLSVLNNDAVLHNVHATMATGGPAAITVFNVAMPFKGQKLPQPMKKPGVVKLRCDAGHTWMNAFVHVFDHPWFAVTDAKGAFTIKDVPAGEHTLTLWHEPVDDKSAPLIKEVTVTVADGKTATVDVALTP